MGDPTDTIERLLADMTLDEKASLTAGISLWYLPPVERLGIPALKVSDGPSGVRGDSLIGRRSLSLPCGMAVGSTWDTELASRLGDVLAAEARSKHVHVLLGPTVCIVRTPLAGRTFESFSEDPHLTSRLAVAYVQGVQRHGVACCIKHFACNDQEHERMTISASVDERTLHEVHLPAFEAAVGEAGVWAVMTAYNKVNGTYCGEQPDLIGRVLRQRWGFDGVVMSDWFGTHSTAPAAQAGLDLEMPGPSAWFSQNLAAAVRAGDVDEVILDGQARHLLTLMARVGILENGSAAGTYEAPSIEGQVDDPGRRAVAREVATEGTVMLTNDGVLPIDPSTLVGKKVAVIGPNARMLAMGGGSSEVTPHRRRRVADALAERLPGADVIYEEGCRIDKGVATIDMALLEGGGWRVDYFDNAERAGAPVATDDAYIGRFSWIGRPHAALTNDEYSVRISGTFTPDVSGIWEMGLESAGRSVMHLNGAVVVDNAKPERGTGFYGAGSTFVQTSVALEAGTTYEIVIEIWPTRTGWPILGARIGAAPPLATDAFERAVTAAADAEVAVLVVGLNGAWESEGFDRPDLSLPGDQARLITAVQAVNPRTVVVVNAGSPVDLPSGPGATLVCWYAGEEGADALADIITGASDPGGRLPVSWPNAVEDGAAAGSARRYPGVDGTVHYEEGVLVGYRHFEAHGLEPAFCFGHGLTYGDLTWGDVHVTAHAVSVDVTNAGLRSGTEVVQVYVRGEDGPFRLAGFAKAHLEPGQSRTLEVALGHDALRHWDTGSHDWLTSPGPYEVMVGASSRDIRAKGEVTR